MPWSDIFDRYASRLGVYGQSESDYMKNSTIAFVNSTFENSTNFKVVKVNSEDIGVRVTKSKDKKGTEIKRDLIFKPMTNVDVGSIVEIDDVSWLMMSFEYDDISPKGTVQLCNREIKWNDGVYHSFPCVATTLQYVRYDIAPDKYDVNTIQGGVFIYAPYNDETKALKLATRIIFGHQVYEVIGIDDVTNTSGAFGVIQFATRLDIKRDGDDFVSEVANNKHVYGDNSQQEDGDLAW